MQHKGTVTLEADRLILRRFQADDAQQMFDNWASDSEVTKFLTWPTHKSVDVSKFVINDWLINYDKNDYYSWGIVIKDTNELVGSISVTNIKECAEGIEIGYCIGRKYWGKGITAEAGRAVVKFLFEEVKAIRVCAYHAPENPNSGKVMKKIGMTYEGTLRQSDICNQGIVDAVIYSILRSEYEAGLTSNINE